MRRSYLLLCCVLAGALAACSPEQARRTRGIGVYPGDPDESAAGAVVPGDDSYRNLALHRIAFHSSIYTSRIATISITCTCNLVSFIYENNNLTHSM